MSKPNHSTPRKEIALIARIGTTVSLVIIVPKSTIKTSFVTISGLNSIRPYLIANRPRLI
jgi:hypothetical protein